MNLSRLLCTALLYAFAISWGLVHAESPPDDRDLALSNRVPLPFAVVELFTSEG
jgi:hypothetical protein